MRLAFGVLSAPKDAPAKIVRQCESEAQALAVAIAATGSNLLRQVRDLQRALAAPDEVSRLAQQLREAA